ncbi:hypothetical protein FB446DRAFT_785027 [Lentinula raphanica]|nr:hypothetical protein FB446DRAFT_785027 [Lentinula raphanica]
MSHNLDDDYPVDYGDGDSEAGSEENDRDRRAAVTHLEGVSATTIGRADGLVVGSYSALLPSSSALPSTPHVPRNHLHSPPTLCPAQTTGGLNDRLTALSQVLRGRTLVQQAKITSCSTTETPPDPPSVTDTFSRLPSHPCRSSHTLSKSSKSSRVSPKSSASPKHSGDKLSRRTTKSVSSSLTLPPPISYPPSTTLERSPVGKETASARIARVENNTIRIDQRIDLLLNGLEDQIEHEVNRRVAAAMTTACEQLRRDLLDNTARSNTGLQAVRLSPAPPSSSTTPALLPPAPLSLPKRPSFDVAVHAANRIGRGTIRTKSLPLLGEPHSLIITLSPECPAFSTTIDFLFDMTREWSTEVERHINSYARLPIPSRIMRIDSHHLQLTFNAFGIEAFLSTWNTFHDAVDRLSHLSISPAFRKVS